MADFGNEVLQAFRDSAADEQVMSARFAVLDTAEATLTTIADLTQTSGGINCDDNELALALLSRLASELSGSICVLARQSRLYAAGALLRQLIELEYLMFLGYMDPSSLGRWYRADARELRKFFSPQQMRNAADGLFRDEEYWLHCAVGGHPHPKSRILLSSYHPPLDPVASLLPDAVQHLRRLWTSLKLVLPKLNVGEITVEEHGQPLIDAINHWLNVEHPLVLTFDGIPRNVSAADEPSREGSSRMTDCD